MNASILKTAAVLSLLTATGWAAMTGNTVEITTGATITRSWAQIQADNYAYSPMQAYTAAGSSYTTKVYLPYDATDGVYYAYGTINFGTNEFGQRSFLNNWSGSPSSLLYKLHFDTTVTGFSLYNCRIFTALAADNTVNIDYSTDGNTWVPLWSKLSGNYENFTNQATGLSTQDLYLRYSTSGPNSGYYMAMVAAGPQASNYDWFVGSMNTLTVTLIPEPAALSLLALGGLPLLRRRPRA